MTRRLLSAIALILLALACAAFVRVNAAPIEIDLFADSVRLPVGQALSRRSHSAGWSG